MGGRILKISAFILLLSFLLSCAPDTAAQNAGEPDDAAVKTDTSGSSVTADTAGDYDKPPKSDKSDMVSVADYGAAGDGITDDGEAIRLAFEDAQESGKTLYFPAGRYNMSGTKLQAEKPFSVAGDENGGSVLLQPRVFDCYSSVKVNDLEIIDDEGVFLNLLPLGSASLQIDNVIYGSTIEYNNKTRFIYCSSKATEDYYSSIEITNCDISNVRYGIQILCRIDSGLVSGNTISKVGNPTELLGAAAIKLGYPNSDEVFAKNILVSNNRITDIRTAYASESETCEAQGIILYGSGGCVIENNYLENIVGGSDHEGIYTKSPDVKIINNTLINAGDGNGAIVSKCNSPENDIIISGNTIVNDFVSERNVCGIYVSGEKFTITDNNISMKSGIAICKGESYNALDVVISANIIETQGRTCLYLTEVTGKAEIRDNTFIQYLSGELDATVSIAKARDGAILDISGNTFRIDHQLPFSVWKAETGADIDIYGNIVDSGGLINELDIRLPSGAVYDNIVF